MSETNNSAPVAASTETSGESVNPENQQQGAEQAPITPKLTKRLKLKVDSQEFDEELPFEVDENNKEQVEYLKRHLQMSKASAKRMQEASLTRKQATDFIQALQNDPMRVLNDPRIMGEEKFRAVAEQFLSKKLQEQMLTPEERKRIEMEEKLRGYEENEKKSKEAESNKQMQQLEQHYADQYQKTIITALSSSNLPKNGFTVRRMAELMQKNINHGLELEPQHLAQLVREDYQKELSSLIGGADADQILSMFGEDVANKIRKHDLQKFKSMNSGVPSQQPKQNAPQNQPPRRMRSDEYEEYIKNKK